MVQLVQLLQVFPAMTTKQVKGELDDIMDHDDWALIFSADGSVRGIFIPLGKTEEDIPDSLLNILNLFEVDLHDAKDAVIH